MSTEPAALEDSPDVDGDLDAETVRELIDTTQRVQARNERLETRVEELEATVEQLVEYRGDGEVLSNMWIDGNPVGKVIHSADKTAKEAYKLAEAAETADASSGDGAQAGRSAMLPAHRMWADIRDGQDDSLSKGQRRAGALFGAFLHRAGGTPVDEAPLPIGYVDNSNQSYSITSTQAKELLQKAEQVTFDGEVYSSTVKRIFKDVQRFTKEADCDCDSIDFCDHGIIQFDSSHGTNVLTANKQQLHDALTAVQEVVEGREVTISDDAVSPEDGPAEETADTLAAEATDELDELADPSNIDVRRHEGDSVRSTNTDRR